MFTHLHLHTDCSLLDGTARPEALAERAAQLGMSSLAITDHGSLRGAAVFARECEKRGIKPIIGVEFYLAYGDRKEKTRDYHHITLLAVNEQGWRNLVFLHNASYDSFYYVPRIDYGLLEKYREGIICLSGCLGGPLLEPLSKIENLNFRQALKSVYGDKTDSELLVEVKNSKNAANNDLENFLKAQNALKRLKKIYGIDHFYVELMSHGIAKEDRVLPLLAEMAEKENLECVATNDSHYCNENDAKSHDGWLAVRVASSQTKNILDDPDRFRFEGEGYFLRSENEMLALRDEAWWKKACANTEKVAQKIASKVLPTPGLHLPSFGAEDSYRLLVEKTWAGAQKRYVQPSVQVVERLKKELHTIRALGLSDYFLISADLLAWARSDKTASDWINGTESGIKKKPILIGPGRGSGAGSLVLYCLNITNIDPLRHGLLFERFLDPTRIGMPDVDTDFEQDRRDEGYEYLQQRYGTERIARLGTIGRAGVKAGIKSGCRLLDIPDSFATKLTKLIGEDEVLGEDFYNLASQYPDQKSLTTALEYGKSFIGLAQNEGIHACGVLISDRDIDGFIPVRNGEIRITAWDGKDIDALGLLKLDLLGLRTLDIIHSACEMAQISPENIPDPDSIEAKPAWDLLCQGDTAGIFQLGSSGMKQLIAAIQPRRWAHLTAACALYRPGPLKENLHQKYADRLNGRETVSYAMFSTDINEIGAIEKVLGETFGLPIYQEQAMELGRIVGGFNDIETNRLRKAISKKIPEEIDALGKLFVSKAPTQGFSSQTAANIWQALEGSARYSFNKSHSCAYGLLSFQTAWLKAIYPAAFTAATLNYTPRGGLNGKNDDIRHEIINSALQKNITICPPDINTSPLTTTAIDPKTIIIGLNEIKDVGKAAAPIIKNRPYSSINDLYQKNTLTTTNLKGLIEAGALDRFGKRKGQYQIVEALKTRPATQPLDSEFDPIDLWARQIERIGISFTTHPLYTALQNPKAQQIINGNFIDPYGNPIILPPLSLGEIKKETTPRQITTIATIATKTIKMLANGKAAFLTLENPHHQIPAVIWSNTLKRTDENLLQIGNTLKILAQTRIRTHQTEEGEETQIELEIKNLQPLLSTHLKPTPPTVKNIQLPNL